MEQRNNIVEGTTDVVRRRDITELKMTFRNHFRLAFVPIDE